MKGNRSESEQGFSAATPSDEKRGLASLTALLRHRRHYLAYVALVTILVFFSWQALSLGYCAQDDAFISFRYASNLTRGYGLVYNPGERVEGYTNFLWTLLLAATTYLGVDPLDASRILGLAFACGDILLVYHFGTKLLSHRWDDTGFVAPVLLACSAAFVVESVQGLETSMFSFLILAAAYARTLEMPQDKRCPWSSLVFALAVLTRPEGMLVFALTFVVEALASKGRIWSFVRESALRLAIFGLLFTPYYLWRFSYYGWLFPNTFYAKATGGAIDLYWGLVYVARFIQEQALVIALSLAALMQGWRRPETRLLWVLCGSYYVYVVAIGGGFKPTFRFLLPILPLQCLLAQEGAREMISMVGRTKWRWPDVKALMIVAMVLLAVVGFRSAAGPRQFALWRAEVLSADRSIGNWLAGEPSPNTLLATPNAGAIPYYSGLMTLDMLGLTNEHIAHMEVKPGARHQWPGHRKCDANYVLSREPQLIIFQKMRALPAPAEIGPDIALYECERSLLASREFEELYRLESVRLGDFYFSYFRRLDLTSRS